MQRSGPEISPRGRRYAPQGHSDRHGREGSRLDVGDGGWRGRAGWVIHRDVGGGDCPRQDNAGWSAGRGGESGGDEVAGRPGLERGGGEGGRLVREERGGERERRGGSGESTAAERGDKGGDEVPGRPDLVVKPGVGCPASRRRGLGADRGSAPDVPSEGGGASVLEKSGEI